MLTTGTMNVSATYLDWVVRETTTQWWHVSADCGELDRGLQRGAIGVTTNPVLASVALHHNRELWRDAIERALASSLPPEQKAEALLRVAVTSAADKLLPRF